MMRRRCARIRRAVVLLLGSCLAMLPPGLSRAAEITFYDYNLAYAGLGADATRRLLQEFMALHPEIVVKGMGVAGTGYAARIQADIAAQLPVDLVQMPFGDLEFTARHLGAVPVSDFVSAAELKAATDGIIPATLRLPVIDGKQYGLPFTLSTPILFYNADLFRAAGLDPEHPPRNWAEVKRASLMIREKTGKHGLATGILPHAAADWLFQALVRSNGGRVISADRKTLTFTDPNLVATVAMLRDLFASGAMEEDVDASGGTEAMASGNLGMLLESSVVQHALTDGAEGHFQLRATTMPAFASKPIRPTNSGSALIVLAHDRENQQAAWQLMKFLTSDHAYAVIASEIGYPPLRPDVLTDPKYLAGWAGSHPMVQPNMAQLAILEPWVTMPGLNYRQIVAFLMDAVRKSVIGGADPAATLAAAQRSAQPLMPE